ncbi:MAG TPA: tail fiber domain-containing protein [Pyrinomonadaceae bacterium]|nr:tail fiber domain-containing protein [Pyrinomonadaceae bacterium]
MFTRRHLFSALLALTLLGASVTAQTATEGGGDAQPPAPAVTAAVTQTGARFTAPVGVSQVRLEIYASGGEVVFDSGMQAGDIIDWKPSDAQQPLADGSYVCVVTVRDLRGRLSRRLGSVKIQSGQIALGRAKTSELSAPQAQALDAARQSRKIESATADDSLTIVREGTERAVTLATHDGQDGQLTSTMGALTLRTGDTLTGQDREQMRVTPEGRVGIGTDKPEATLDVAGTIRARDGIVFADGSVLTSAVGARSAGSGVISAAVVSGGDGNMTPNASGAGTTNKLAKWMDGSGTLGDSAITESGGNIGIGTNTPSQALHVFGKSLFQNTGTASLFIVDRTDGKIAALGAGGISSTLAFDESGIFKIESNSRANIASGVFGTGATTRFTINGLGNVGIGTDTPAERLDMAGNLRINGAGNGIIFPDGTKMTTAASGGSGGSMSGTSIVNAINDPATAGVIAANRLSANVARLNGANTWTGANVFGAGLSANNALITNVGNPVSAGDAVNKAYTDANFVKFVPGAEQLSVGDANGTAPMINLRGGSTCCSGPGGHTPAWFKVFQNGSFVATGNLGIGVSPMQGKGYRTSWDSYKGAFRSGYADNEWDDATVGFFSWAGGSNSTAEGLYSLAFGDTNQARSTSSIVFGSGNEVKGAAGFSAGAGNRVCDTYGVAFGNKALSGGPILADGKCDPDTFNIRGLAAVAIGYNVTASQDHTMALGKFASNNGFSGTFIWSDGAATQSADTFRNTANNEFAARATGGFRFRTNLGGTTGCNLPAGSGVFNCTSSRYTKENFLLADGRDVLSRLRKVPVSTWNYINEGAQVRHIGPMAEDFYQQFGLGTGNTSIGVQDLAGVSLAAVKELDARTLELQQKTAEVERLRAEVAYQDEFVVVELPLVVVGRRNRLELEGDVLEACGRG